MRRPLRHSILPARVAAALGVISLAPVAGGATPPSPSASTAPDAASGTAAVPAPTGSATTEKSWSSCVEYLPDGATRPRVEAHFPSTGLSGHELRLVVTMEHGRGETVLPAGFRLDRSSDAMRAIEAARFRLPDAAGAAQPRIDRPSQDDLEDARHKTLTTTITVPFIALTEKPGRHRLLLPALPIAVARANGQLMTVCTSAMPVAIEDPIANESEPKLRPNAPPRSQQEEWQLAKQVALGTVAVLALAALGAWWLHRWSRRPKAASPIPAVPPWESALEELGRIRESRLLADGHLDVFVDRVNDCVRRYLGERFGFDGLESTTEEIRKLLGRVQPAVVARPAIEAFLADTDLVKFAKFTPGPDDCVQILGSAEAIVHATIPVRFLVPEGRT